MCELPGQGNEHLLTEMCDRHEVLWYGFWNKASNQCLQYLTAEGGECPIPWGTQIAIR